MAKPGPKKVDPAEAARAREAENNATLREIAATANAATRRKAVKELAKRTG